MSYLSVRSYLIACLVTCTVLGRGAWGAPPATFEELLSQASANKLEAITAFAESAAKNCACSDDEFKVRDCQKEQAEAKQLFRMSAVFSLPLGTNLLEL